ncbi:hypothetical protein AUK10_00125 [Candidatus Gracilibacteria bacterium CG2_30_37_12]|nr:MAG: hypothetical protein AUK10_00125 [Candidatus Gracilibacteria bacterium CG2_30_37_12]
MAVISVEVPDAIARRFKPYTIVKYEYLFEKKTLEESETVDGAGWVDFEVNMDAGDFLKSLKKDVLDFKK